MNFSPSVSLAADSSLVRGSQGALRGRQDEGGYGMHWFTLTMVIIGALAVSVEIMKVIERLEKPRKGRRR